jgi:DNA repair exonuclease SbcCD nuclease subunit
MHGDYERFRDKRIKRLKKGDFLIVAGDFGFLWDKTPKEDRILKKIGRKRFYTLFIEGCHDNYDLIESYPKEEFCGGLARNISGRLYHLERGGIFNLGGVRIFAFGGGVTADINERAAQNRWWVEEAATEEETARAREVLEDHDWKFDAAVTHEAPATIKEFMGYEINLLTHMHRFFDEVKDKAAFTKWYFGKLHRRKVIPPKFIALFDDCEYIATNPKEEKKLKKLARKKL